ncbi:MAG: pyridoxal phosphate-dependent aminotransferase [Gammaproteobacteria bacterium]|nr:pyridoxal phosphate-dependent aminotransferase [Gammaproteobacteria bacterium]
MTFITDIVSDYVHEAEISAIKEMAMLGARVEGAASLAWGLPSFRTPDYIRDEVKNRLDQDPDAGKYTLPDGLPEFRQLVAEKYLADTGVEVSAADNVMICAGNMQALNTVFHTMLDPGDEIILTDPCFASHIQQIILFNGKPVYWPLDEANNWSLDIERLPRLITEKTQAIVLVSPSNPTGKIFTEQELRQVGEIALQHDILVIIDDPYSDFTYENREKYFNLACVERLREHIVYMYTFSKAYAMSGWRLAYMILPAELKREAMKVHDATMICTPRISQLAGIADSRSFAIDLLNNARVTVTPGSAFGPSGEHHVRLAYCVDEDTINLAFDRIENYFPGT